MRKITRTLVSILAALTLTAATPGCGSNGPSQGIEFPASDDAVTPRLSRDAAAVIARTALAGYNASSYEQFTTAWSAGMRAGIGPERFTKFQQETMALGGRFLSILESRVTRGRTEGTVRFYYLCAFEQREMVFILAFQQDGEEVIGISLEPAIR